MDTACQNDRLPTWETAEKHLLLQVLFRIDRPVVIAVVTVRVMKSAIDYVVGMVSMRDSFVSAARAMHMAIVMLDRPALVWIRFVNLQTMLIVVIAVFVVHMTVMQVVDVISMFDLGVTTVFTVHMVVILMYFTFFVSHYPLLHSNCRTIPV